jgi:hypothetical protein
MGWDAGEPIPSLSLPVGWDGMEARLLLSTFSSSKNGSALPVSIKARSRGARREEHEE